MIRLTLNPQLDPEIHLFNKPSITLGSKSNCVDLFLSGSNIQSNHLKIVKENDQWTIINEINDPFVLVNGHSFWKKKLSINDLITVHDNQILFEIVSSPSPEKDLENPSSDLGHQQSSPEESSKSSFQITSDDHYQAIDHFVLPFEHEVEPLKDLNLNHQSVEEYIKQIEQNKIKQKVDLAPPIEPLKTISENSEELINDSQSTKKTDRKSLKDDYLKDLDDDQDPSHSNYQESSIEQSHLFQAWKWILFFIFSLLVISGVVGTVIYYSVSDKTEAHETKAMLATADIAMALTHAQLSNAKPHNNNWADLDFLKNNLQTLLPNTHSYASQLDAQGQFHCCPYSLRVYTNSDFSHFILIAQPAPSLLYWLIPKPIIVVDSHLMNLHSLKDVRSLNRLLANPEPLEGMNGKEITSLIKQGNLITLKALAKEAENLTFNPPEELSSHVQGAENLIHNAPRYYQLSQSICQKAIHLAQGKSSSIEVMNLKKEISILETLQPLILYSTDGILSAKHVKNGLNILSPTEKIISGYLVFNDQGSIIQAKLFTPAELELDNSDAVISLNDTTSTLGIKDISSIQEDENLLTNTENSSCEESNIDKNHPIYIELHTKILNREQQLKPIADKMTQMIQQELREPNKNFMSEFQVLLQSFQLFDTSHIKEIQKSLHELSIQYGSLSAQDFCGYIEALHLNYLIQENDDQIIKDSKNIDYAEELLDQVDISKNFTELNERIIQTSKWLNFDNFNNHQDLIYYQNLLRNILLAKIQNYLFSPIPNKDMILDTKEKQAFELLLQQEKYIRPEEKEYFSLEFQILSQENN
ncbi:MAG: FHA domain-containing protein [Parachlamydiaceae bacterium]|nr:FHA domain-containing protein [Parachlamydiaceae bacterium]